MPRYKIQFARDVTGRDYVERVIEARDADHARELADQMASEFNSNCPDDTTTYAGDCEDWEATDLGETDEPLSEDETDV